MSGTKLQSCITNGLILEVIASTELRVSILKRIRKGEVVEYVVKPVEDQCDRSSWLVQGRSRYVW